MIEGLIGKKVGMTQVFTEQGERIPVTVVELGPVTVIQKKTVATDGYDAVQIGFKPISEGKKKNVTKPLMGHFKSLAPFKHLQEFAVEDIDAVEVGQEFDVTVFKEGQIVDVSGISKGRGFAGVLKRHNFGGGPGGHGHRRMKRGTGSIGQSATPAKVFKGKKMPGHHGNVRVTVQGLEVVGVKKDLNVLLVKGGIPGPNGRLVEIRGTVKPK